MLCPSSGQAGTRRGSCGSDCKATGTQFSRLRLSADVEYKNLLNRDFHASKPNSKWVTDISYIHTKQGVLYLSMIRDLYDNSIVACKTGTEQTVNLVLDTIRLAMKQEKEKVAVELQLHSDQGAQYASQAYFKLTQTYGITPSMSRRGTPYDNAMAENFCSILKTECIYRHKPATFSQANELIAIFTSTTMSASS